MMGRLVCFKEEDWDYFCTRINWDKSALDARAISIMNEPIMKDEDEVT